jgi:hypothetical protein
MVPKMMALTRWFKVHADVRCNLHDARSPAVSSSHPGSRRVSATSALPHGLLTACVDACRW